MNSLINPRMLCWLGLLIMAVSLSITKVGLSIGSILILLAGLWQFGTQRFRFNPKDHKHALVISSLFLVSVIGVIVTDDIGGWADDLRIKIPILLLPLSISLCAPFRKKENNLILGAYILTQIIVAGLSIFVAYGDYENLSLRVSQNSFVHVISGLHHIYFGPILGLAGLVGLNWGFRQTDNRLKYLFVAGGVMCAILLHLFTSRTGFLAFYAGVGGWAMWLIISRKAWGWGLGAIALICLIPVVAYQTVPTFKTRVQVTQWDFEQYLNMEQGGDLSDLTVALRFMAWKASYSIWQKSPVLGTGFGDLDQELSDELNNMNIVSREDQLLRSAHNEYMEYLAGAGVVGLLVLISVFIYPLFDKYGNSESLMWIHVAMVATACLSESFLERQVGVAFYVLFGVFFATLSKK